MTLLHDIPPQVTAVLEVDLSAIAANYQAVSSLVQPGTKTGAVVKGNAYGLGLKPICKRLYQAGCRDFFFAFLEEATEGRESVPADDAHTYVLYGLLDHTEELMLKHRLTPALISFDQLERWAGFAAKVGSRLPCLLHVDTGMGREGLSSHEFQKLMDHKEEYFSKLDVRYLISHIGNSNDASDPKNERQYERFLSMYQQLPSGVKATLVNSSGITLGTKYQFDLVRPGLSLYGYKSTWGEYIPLQPSVKAYGRILLTRTVPKGETIGYQGTFECKRDTRLALISVGHADGILRIASNVGSVKINQYPAQFVGRVSMDVLIVDITDHPEGNVIPGQWATLYDDEDSIRAFAEAEQTSIYELLVRHGRRYYRIYKE